MGRRTGPAGTVRGRRLRAPLFKGSLLMAFGPRIRPGAGSVRRRTPGTPARD